MQIVGAGLAGLIAANIFPQARIIEAQGREKLEHKALLRFRSTAVADATGVEFRKVRVHKGVCHEGRACQPSIALANLYSKKVIGKLADRSIWNLDAADRYVAPEDFISVLIDNCGDRISWNTAFSLINCGVHEPIISTMPMGVLAQALPDGLSEKAPLFEHKQIGVTRIRVRGADVFQTIYFTDPETPVYRASITGDLLIVETIGEELAFDLGMVLGAFGLGLDDISEIDSSKHKFGKIAPINDQWRKRFILRASTDHNIYSLGRFATWRNILLDDVVHDAAVIKRLIKLGDNYSNKLKA